MSNPGQIYTDTSNNKTYQCVSGITISPSLMDKDGTVTSTWKRLQNSGETIIETPKTIVLEDENGNKVVAVLVDQEIDFTATPNDIREGMVAATDDGVTVGEKFIPSYVVTEGAVVRLPGESLYIKISVNDLYDYTRLQAIVCPYNTTLEDSVCCDHVVIDDHLYKVLTTVSVCEVATDSENKTIELGIGNTSDIPCVIRFFTYKEVY